jgi:trans-2-enoyl-CoA reductase
VGTWRTHAQLDEGRLMRVEKDGLTPNQIGSVSVNPTTAYQMLQAFGDMKAGEWYVQNGANSGVGRAAVQLGKMWGFNSLCIVRQREGVEMLKEELMALGATRVVTDEEVLTQGFQDRVKEWTRGGREEMKLGLNCVGGKVTTRMAGLLSSGGYFITYGAMSKQPFPIPAGLYIFKDLTFKGFWVSRWSNANPEEKKRVVEELLGLMRDGKFKDTPVEEFEWKKETTLEELRAVIGGTLEGFRGGKSVFLHR